MSENPALPEPPMQVAVPRPMESSAVHFRAHGRCYAALVVDVIADSPLSPEFQVDLVVFAPRNRQQADKFTRVSSLPGTTRWANNLAHADRQPDGSWTETTWHYASARCIPEVILDGPAS